MKKIVFVLEQLYGGGAERVTNALANEMCKMPECEVHILTYRQDEKNEYPQDSRVVRHDLGQTEADPNGLRGILRRVRYLRRTIRKIEPWCVVSLATPKTVCLLTTAMVGLDIPLVLSERNDPVRFPAEKLVRVLRVLCYRRATGVVFQTHEAMKFFDQSIQKKAVVICNPITGSLPERFVGERQKRVVNVCRLDPQKNLPLLIAAFSLIAEEYPTHTLCIYGDGPLRTQLTEQCRALGLQDRVLLPGYSNNIYEDIREAALFVSSSDYEGISNSMLEAIALGVPSICTDCPAGGARETIRNGENGLLVPVGDAQAMAAAMRRVLSDEEFSKILSRKGSELRYRISAEAVATRWMEFLEKLQAEWKSERT